MKMICLAQGHNTESPWLDSNTQPCDQESDTTNSTLQGGQSQIFSIIISLAFSDLCFSSKKCKMEGAVPKVVNLFSCSTPLSKKMSMKILLVTIVGILKLMGMIDYELDD